MYIETIVALHELQKAQIVSRNEELPDYVVVFEMSEEKAATIARLRGTYAVRQDQITATAKNSQEWLHVYPARGGGDMRLPNILAEEYAAGRISAGANIDYIIDKFADRLEEIKQERIRKEQEAEQKRIKTEKEKPLVEWRKMNAAILAAKRDAAEQAEKDKTAEQKRTWIKLYGSERLQKAAEQGYNCQKQYIIEFGRMYLPGYDLDYDEDIKTKGRSCPSLEAMQEVERLIGQYRSISAKVVWLPNGTATEEGCYEYECDMQQSCEAVEAIILGNYFYKEFE